MQETILIELHCTAHTLSYDVKSRPNICVVVFCAFSHLF